MGKANVAGVPAVPTAHPFRGSFEQGHRRASLTGRNGRAQSGVASANDQDVDGREGGAFDRH